MNEKANYKIEDGLNQAFINSEIVSEPSYTPAFITNQTLLMSSQIERELKSCSDFMFSVAFITPGGIEPLKLTLRELENKGIKGKIITTDYLTFSNPKALDFLNGLSNIELKMFKTAENEKGFHTKGYVFHYAEGDLTKIIVGSSNLTQDALMRNIEWNTKIISQNEGYYKKAVEAEFDNLWLNKTVDYKEYSKEYKEKFDTQKTKRKLIEQYLYTLDHGEPKDFKPNEMQKAFINGLNDIMNKKKDRALLISATGTGKTYASAFGIRNIFEKFNFNPKHILFLSHRGQINIQAEETYKNVFGENFTMGLVSGGCNEDNYKANFIFSTVQMMSKKEVMGKFSEDYFSVIILDECHRAGADSYQKIINYFKPKLLLGMSASPERTDDFNIFQLFGYNIAYEIRLQDALSKHLLCPFHYFGISEFKVADETTGKMVDKDKEYFRYLTSRDRISYIIKNINYFGYCGSRVKGLVFCSRNDEARELSKLFNDMGYNTVAISGEDSVDTRLEMIDRLVSDDPKVSKIDYIFTVDIFNEGVDIPEVNQIVMLRPTQSQIIFVQQLGRGLRKSKDKEFVVIIDFIGNYENNYMIPAALNGDNSGNKDNIRRHVEHPYIQGESSIHFDEVSRERIYRSIDSARLNEVAKLKNGYKDLKFKLGHIPSMMDFDNYEAIDIMRIINNRNLNSYHTFLCKYEPEYSLKFSGLHNEMIDFISTKFASGKRIHELLLLKMLVNDRSNNIIEKWKEKLFKEYGFTLKKSDTQSVINILTGVFYAIGSLKNKVSKYLFIEKTESGKYKISSMLESMLNNEAFKEIYLEIIEFGIHRYSRDYSRPNGNTSFNLYKKYTYEDVCRLLFWEKSEVSLNIGGYKYDSYSNTYPVFINYEKADDISETTKYEDRFTDQSHLIAISKSKRTSQSADVQTALNSSKHGIEMVLFVRKNKDDQESKEFYYLGRIKPTGYYKDIEMTVSDNENVSAVEINYRLEQPVEQALYDYLTN